MFGEGEQVATDNAATDNAATETLSPETLTPENTNTDSTNTESKSDPKSVIGECLGYFIQGVLSSALYIATVTHDTNYHV